MSSGSIFLICYFIEHLHYVNLFEEAYGQFFSESLYETDYLKMGKLSFKESPWGPSNSTESKFI